jgi:VanZ family protein
VLQAGIADGSAPFGTAAGGVALLGGRDGRLIRTADNLTRTFVRYWLPVILWTAVITLASTDEFSARNTGNVIEKVITAILGHPLPPEQFDPLHFVIRKLAHLTEYGILGALAFRACRAGERGWNAKWALTAVAVALAVAVGDEFHQRFVPTRTASPIDVMIDTAGATISQIVWRFATDRRETGFLRTS